MLALEAKGSGKSQLAVLDNAAVTGSSVIDIDSQTKQVSITLTEDILSIAATGNIGLLGFATVKDTFSDAPPMSTQFTLDLEVVENVSRLGLVRNIFSSSPQI